MKKTLLQFTAAQIVFCLLFVLCDRIEEHTGSHLSVSFGLFALPAAEGILFCLFDAKLQKQNGIGLHWLHCLASAVLWAVECAVFGLMILWTLVGSFELIPQRSGGLNSGWFLNGLEYLFFPLFEIVIVSCIILIWGVGTFLYRRKKENRAGKA